MRFAAVVAFACVLLAGCRTTQPGAAMPNRADPVAAAAQQSRAEALGLDVHPSIIVPRRSGLRTAIAVPLAGR